MTFHNITTCNTPSCLSCQEETLTKTMLFSMIESLTKTVHDQSEQLTKLEELHKKELYDEYEVD